MKKAFRLDWHACDNASATRHRVVHAMFSVTARVAVWILGIRRPVVYTKAYTEKKGK